MSDEKAARGYMRFTRGLDAQAPARKRWEATKASPEWRRSCTARLVEKARAAPAASETRRFAELCAAVLSLRGVDVSATKVPDYRPTREGLKRSAVAEGV